MLRRTFLSALLSLLPVSWLARFRRPPVAARSLPFVPGFGKYVGPVVAGPGLKFPDPVMVQMRSAMIDGLAPGGGHRFHEVFLREGVCQQPVAFERNGLPVPAGSVVWLAPRGDGNFDFALEVLPDADADAAPRCRCGAPATRTRVEELDGVTLTDRVTGINVPSCNSCYFRHAGWCW